MSTPIVPYEGVPNDNTPTLPSAPNLPFTSSQDGVQTPTILQIEADFAGAVDNGEIAANAIAEVGAFTNQLGALIGSLAPPIIVPNFPQNTNAPAISAPVAPGVTPIVYVPPPIPAAFTGQLDVNTNFPDFTAEPPQLLFPNAPQANIGQVPSAPLVDYNYEYPTLDVDLPPAPDLLTVQVSKFDGVNFPFFNTQAPTLNLVGPQIYGYLADAPYADQLLTSTKAFLLDRLENGTGTALPPAMEQNIYNREAEREYRQQAAALMDLDKMEAMGFALPPGAYVDARIKIQTDTMATLAGSSRDIAVAQAKLAQDNILKALEQSNLIESKLIEYANLREQRNFDATKYATDAGIQIYNAQVEAFKTRLEVYRSAITLYQAQLEGAKTQVAVYQAEIDAEKLKVDMNNSLVQQYKVQVEAALASIQVFQGQIDLLKTRASIEQLKVSTYGELVKAYVAQANVYQAEVEGYKAAVSAEQTKQATYATSAQAYATLVEAKAKEIDANVAEFRALIEAKNEEYNAYKAQVEGASENVKALAATNSAVADIYRANVQGTSSYNDAMVKEWEAQITLAEKVAEIGVQAAQASGQLYISTRSIASDAAKAAAQVQAQVAASALGTVTYATHRARQDNVSYQNSQSTSHGTSMSVQQSQAYNIGQSYTFDMLPHFQNNVSNSASNSTVYQVQQVSASDAA